MLVKWKLKLALAFRVYKDSIFLEELFSYRNILDVIVTAER